ncbi:MAG: hypothetical protein ABIZ95_03120 [Pyrinomonadaceae bacterium]
MRLAKSVEQDKVWSKRPLHSFNVITRDLKPAAFQRAVLGEGCEN